MSSERGDLLAMINAYFKAKEIYEFEQTLNDAFNEWTRVCEIRPTGKKYEISLQKKYSGPEGFSLAKSAAEKFASKYRSLTLLCGEEGYEGIAYLVNYAVSFVHLGETTLEVPKPVIDLAIMDLESIWSKNQPVL